MKKYAAFALALALSFSLLAGCGKSSEAESCSRSSVRLTNIELDGYLTPPEGTVTAMLIPIYVPGFSDEYGEKFNNAAGMRMTGGFYGDPLMGVREYFLNASYGRLTVDYEIMPVYYPDITLSEYSDGYLYSCLAEEAFRNAVNNYEGDLSRFDSDGNGSADMVIFVTSEKDSYAAAEFGLDRNIFCSMRGELPLALYNAVHISALYMYPVEPDFVSDSFIAQLSLLFGIKNYMNYSDDVRPACFDMQEMVHQGDWNPYSKLCAGWIQPYVADPSAKRVTVTLKSFSEAGDVLLIPASSGWNGTARDEFLLVDVVNDKGNNAKAWSTVQIDPDHCPEGGVRISHVDGRSIPVWYYSDRQQPAQWIEDFGDLDPLCDDYWVCYAYSNSSANEINEIAKLAPEPSKDFRLLIMADASQKGSMTKYMKTSYLFAPGQTFTPEDYQELFPNYPLADDGSRFNVQIKVDSFNADSGEAVITVIRK